MRYLLLFVITFAVPAAVILLNKKLVKETMIQLLVIAGGVTLVTSLVMLLIKQAASWDTQILNGYVTDKKAIKKECPRGWKDYRDSFCTNYTTREVVDWVEEVCSRNDKGVESCHDVTHYKTQYNYDFEWEKKYYVYTTLKNFEIDRIDHQGAKEPPRFTVVEINEPVAVKDSYQNHLLLADQSLINPALLELPDEVVRNLPEYPNRVYDYWRLNRFITLNSLQDHNAWNAKLSEMNSRLGHSKQANVILIVTTERQQVRDEVYRHWNGGKKNDIIVFFGIDKDTSTVEWTDAIMFLNNTGNEFLAAGLRTFNGTTLSLDIFEPLEAMIKKRFNREPMESIDFVKENYQLPLHYWIIAYVIAFTLCLIPTLMLTYKGEEK